jgi:single-stranded-DNA-specific exonuclease
MLAKHWSIAPALAPDLVKEYRRQAISEAVAQILYNRAILPYDAGKYLLIPEQKPNPFELTGMRAAVDRIRDAIKQSKSIAIYGDFDADGVTSTALMVSFLRALGANVRPYIPHRIDEGYGLNTPALQALARQGVRLVVTVDCGVRSIDEVRAGVEAGLDIIITDHHSIGADGIVPDKALAVVNPQQDESSLFKGLAGVGVAFMLARALLMDAFDRNGKTDVVRQKYESLLDSLLDLVAVGTVADIMPLNNLLNRSLVKRGLERMNSNPRLGLQALIQVSALKQGQLNAGNIGFALAPRINAAGRLDSAEVACDLMLETDKRRALELATKLNDLNERRQKLTRDSQIRVRDNIEREGLDQASLIFVQDDQILAGIVGLVAGRLTEEYYRPTVVLEHGEHESRASCRSIPEFHITQALDSIGDLLLRHGGHSMAAGFTVLNDNLDAIRQHLLACAQEQLAGLDLKPTLHIDKVLEMYQMTMDLANELEALEPTGHRNAPAIFVTYGMEIVEARTVGNDKSHLRLKLKTKGEPPIDAIGFGMGERVDQLPPYVDIAYHLEVNVYQERRNLQLRILDIQTSQEAR